eukprot:365718-Chlamydomonas_euryale.AAC.2
MSNLLGLLEFQWSKVLNTVLPGLPVQGTFRLRCLDLWPRDRFSVARQLEKVPKSGATTGTFLMASPPHPHPHTLIELLPGSGGLAATTPPSATPIHSAYLAAWLSCSNNPARCSLLEGNMPADHPAAGRSLAWMLCACSFPVAATTIATTTTTTHLHARAYFQKHASQPCMLFNPLSAVPPHTRRPKP